MDATVTPSAEKPIAVPAIEEADDDDEEDETLTERLVGLTEMFPEPVRNMCGKAANIASVASKKGYSFTRSAVWIVASAATILVLPVVLESEIAQQKEMQKMHERQMLLGPNAAMAGPGQNMMPQGMMPPMMPPPGGS